MPLRRLFKCYAFHAYAKMSAHEFLTADIFASACAARLQILPCGRSGEICSEHEPCLVRLARVIAHLVRLSLVGVARFELAALRSRTVRATKLRYTPIVVFSCFVSFLKQECFLMFGSASRAHRRFCCRAVRSSFLPMSRCIVFSLPLPYATQTALHPDSGGMRLFRILNGMLNNISNIECPCQEN